ncbi:expressed protein [Phakopsora pachyrhizi]|uniref:Expressed protein n=1 Tax=Phakopsora pachyrhizi TaxID=170000 RepID=A0AAV0BJ27_PHAPC|nr:expressed protein [Phakopsora pachyrhizi]
MSGFFVSRFCPLGALTLAGLAHGQYPEGAGPDQQYLTAGTTWLLGFFSALSQVRSILKSNQKKDSKGHLSS